MGRIGGAQWYILLALILTTLEVTCSILELINIKSTEYRCLPRLVMTKRVAG